MKELQRFIGSACAVALMVALTGAVLVASQALVERARLACVQQQVPETTMTQRAIADMANACDKWRRWANDE